MKMKNVICNCCLTSHYIFPCHEDVSSAKIRVSFFCWSSVTRIELYIVITAWWYRDRTKESLLK